MKNIIFLFILALLTFQAVSQPILRKARVQTIINAQGDTLIQMKLSDAKVILNRVLEAQITDSILNIYQLRDTLRSNTMSMQVSEIKLLQERSVNQDILVGNLTKILNNDKEEIKLINQTLSDQKKEIRKLKWAIGTTVVAGVAGIIGTVYILK